MGKNASPEMTYICCNESKNKNASKKEPHVSEGVREKYSISKGRNEVILAKRTEGHMLYSI